MKAEEKENPKLAVLSIELHSLLLKKKKELNKRTNLDWTFDMMITTIYNMVGKKMWDAKIKEINDTLNLKK